MEHKEKRKFVAYFRNFIYGVEDSLVSTVGLLSGVAIANVSRSSILIAGIVLIFVEAFSMAVGSFLSEESAEEYLGKSGEEQSDHSAKASIIMFFSYFVSGFIPLAPYLFLPVSVAFWVSIGLAMMALFILGWISAKISKGSKLKTAFKMLIFGGIAIILGVVVGKLVAGI